MLIVLDKARFFLDLKDELVALVDEGLGLLSLLVFVGELGLDALHRAHVRRAVILHHELVHARMVRSSTPSFFSQDSLASLVEILWHRGRPDWRSLLE